MNAKNVDMLFNQFLADAPKPAAMAEHLPPAQTSVMISIATNNAAVLARDWHLSPPRADLKERIENDTVESDDVDVSFTTTWTLMVCGYFLTQYFFTRGFELKPVDFDQLQQMCKENYDRNMNDLLSQDLELLVAKCKRYLVEGYSRQEHFSEMLKDGRITMNVIEDLVEKSILAGVFVWQMSDFVRRRSN